MKKFIYLLGFMMLHHNCYSQLSLDADSVEHILLHAPAFSIFKDNYFITGTTLGEEPTKYNSDAKFQFSFKERLLNIPVRKKSFLYLTYTQKSFWDIYETSSPFGETNYNPGLMLVSPTFKDKEFSGGWIVSLEHESNGKDSIYSRSWNFVSVTYAHFFSPRLTGNIKAWIPFGLSDNPDLMDYIGYGELQVQYTVIENKCFFDLITRKGASWDWKGSFQASLSYSPFHNKSLSLMLQWWQGYAESLASYNESNGMLRFGLLIKPSYLRFY